MRRVRVGDLIELQRRKVEVDPIETYEEIGVRSFGRGIFHKEPVAGTALGNKRVFKVCPGDLVFNNVFAWEGAVALAGPSETGKCGSHRFLTYTARTRSVDLSYLLYFFISEAGLAALGAASPGSAGRNRTLAIERFENLTIPLPDRQEQHRIAARLAAIRDNADGVAKLARHADALERALAASTSRSDARRVELRGVVEQVRRQENVEPDNEYALLGVRWYAEGLFVRERRLGPDIAASKLFRVEAGDFVYNRLFAWKGAFAIAGEAEAGCYVSNEFPCFRIDEQQVERRYLLALFSDPAMWDAAGVRSAGGTPTSRNRLAESKFLGLEIPLPPRDEQRRVATLVDRIREVSSSRREQILRADALSQSALNAAFRDGR